MRKNEKIIKISSGTVRLSIRKSNHPLAGRCLWARHRFLFLLWTLIFLQSFPSSHRWFWSPQECRIRLPWSQNALFVECDTFLRDTFLHEAEVDKAVRTSLRPNAMIKKSLTKYSDQCTVRIFSEVLIVVRQNAFQKLVFFFCLCFYHVLAIVWVEEKLSGLGVGNKLDKIIVAWKIILIEIKKYVQAMDTICSLPHTDSI